MLKAEAKFWPYWPRGLYVFVKWLANLSSYCEIAGEWQNQRCWFDRDCCWCVYFVSDNGRTAAAKTTQNETTVRLQGRASRAIVASNGSPYAKGPLSVLSVCNVGVLWPNGWMDQDATWHGGRPRPRRRCVRLGHSSIRKWAQHPLLFGPCLSWLNSDPSQQLLSSCSERTEAAAGIECWQHLNRLRYAGDQ